MNDLAITLDLNPNKAASDVFRIHESGSDSESLVLTDHKNNYFTKIGGTKNVHGSNSRGLSYTTTLQ